MKKLLVFFIALVIGTAGCFAYSYPRWKTMPIRVYVPSYGDYTTLMLRAFSAWQQKSRNTVTFKLVNNQRDADIYVGFVDYVSTCHDSNAVGCTASSSKNGFYTQNYIEIGTKESKMVYDRYGRATKVEEQRSAEHIYGVMLHEIGHAIGLEHSKDPNSIMYYQDLDDYQQLTDVDMNLLFKKYR